MYGANVAVIEGARLGGTCVNVGCVPKKVMWNTASIAESLKEAAAYGFTFEGTPKFDWNTVKVKRDAYIKRLNGIYETNLTKDKIDIIHGFATFVNNTTVKVGEDTYSAKHILVATGSSAWIPDTPGAREFGVTSDGFFDLVHLPKKVAIVGAGYIAVELAGIFHALGSKVSLFIRHKDFLRTFDRSIRDSLMDEYKASGMDIVDESQIVDVKNTGTNLAKNLSLNVVNKVSLTQSKHEGYEELIFAVGRVANTEGLGLQSTDVKLDSKGFMVVDEFQNTNVPSILALGDIWYFIINIVVLKCLLL
jgi:glutathione reductase (NADPH)